MIGMCKELPNSHLLGPLTTSHFLYGGTICRVLTHCK